MPPQAASARSVALLQVDPRGIFLRRDELAAEEPLEIQLSYNRGGLRAVKRVAVTMRTPGHDAELAAGFLFAEGIVTGTAQIREIAAGDPPQGGAGEAGRRIRVTLGDDAAVDLRPLARNFTVNSSCGVCGRTSLEGLRVTPRAPLPPGAPRIAANVIRGLPDALRAAQAGFDRTGGLHAAGLFAPDGTLLAVREDVGRHNAVDKLIGAQLLAGRLPLHRCGLLVSGRASFELMQKALMAGLPVLAAVGAPSSLAVELARRSGATLLGFVRDGRFNIYSGARRLHGVAPAAVAAGDRQSP
jgi:FdhD protein